MLHNPKKKAYKVNIVKVIKEEFSTIMKGEPVIHLKQEFMRFENKRKQTK
jgi:hypothetical protein